MQKSGPVRVVAQTGPGFFFQIALKQCFIRHYIRLAAFNFFERELKDINFHFCYAQALSDPCSQSVRIDDNYYTGMVKNPKGIQSK